MGIKEAKGNTKSNFVGYSQFLGSLVLDNESTRALVNKAKEIAGGDAVVKKGFVGLGADSASGKARNFLKENKVPLGFNIDGKIISAFFKEVEDTKQGVKYPFLKLVLQDDVDGIKENTVLSVSMQSELAHKIVQKLEHATPGEQIEIGAWADYEPNPKDPNGRLYSGHNASVKQNGEQIKVPEGVKHYDQVKALVDAKHQKLVDAGFERNDSNKEMFSKARQATTVGYYKDILQNKIEPKFAAFKAAAKEAVDHDDNRAAAGVGEEPPMASHDDASFDPAASIPMKG